MTIKPTKPAMLDLLNYVFDGMSPPLVASLTVWLNDSTRFYHFFATYRDKIRKKVRTTQDTESLADVQAELAVAYLLLQDRRCVVEYEPLGIRKQRAPDFVATFKTHTAFSVEVTRLRSPAGAAENLAGNTQKVANTLCEKLGQFPPGMINLLALVGEPRLDVSDDLRRAWQHLQTRAQQKDDAFFARRGLTDARHFHRQQQRLSAILLCNMDDHLVAVASNPWFNPQAKHLPPNELKNLLAALVGKPTL